MFVPKRGMWVTYKGKVAVLNDWATLVDKVNIVTSRITPAWHGDVHFVNKKGETIEEVMIPLDKLKKAKLSEIPKDRIPTKAHIATAKRKGYE
jgi:hypothetical protein